MLSIASRPLSSTALPTAAKRDYSPSHGDYELPHVSTSTCTSDPYMAAEHLSWKPRGYETGRTR
jgi:hypothetical protein